MAKKITFSSSTTNKMLRNTFNVTYTYISLHECDIHLSVTLKDMTLRWN